MFGDKYKGPYVADPTKTRECREAELRGLMGSEDGRLVILQLYHEANGTHMGVMLRAGTRLSSLIEKILDHEYPQN